MELNLAVKYSLPQNEVDNLIIYLFLYSLQKEEKNEISRIFSHYFRYLYFIFYFFLQTVQKEVDN